MYLKKLIVIVTFILITVYSTGSFFIYFGYLYSYQNTYQSYIKTNTLKLVTKTITLNPSALYVNTKQLIWEDDNKEVVVDGVLYDIISIDSNNGKVELTVLSDDKEQEIKKQFASNYNLNSSTSTNNPLKLLKQFLALKFINTAASISNISVIYNNTNIFTNYTFCIASVYLSQETPPPNFTA